MRRETRTSVEKVRAFLTENYLENPEMCSENMSAAIRDVLTDLLHLGDSFNVNIHARLEDAQEVYEEELLIDLSHQTGCVD